MYPGAVLDAMEEDTRVFDVIVLLYSFHRPLFPGNLS